MGIRQHLRSVSGPMRKTSPPKGLVGLGDGFIGAGQGGLAGKDFGVFNGRKVF
jgi:hypothetical protein